MYTALTAVADRCARCSAECGGTIGRSALRCSKICLATTTAWTRSAQRVRATRNSASGPPRLRHWPPGFPRISPAAPLYYSVPRLPRRHARLHRYSGTRRAEPKVSRAIARVRVHHRASPPAGWRGAAVSGRHGAVYNSEFSGASNKVPRDSHVDEGVARCAQTYRAATCDPSATRCIMARGVATACAAQ